MTDHHVEVLLRALAPAAGLEDACAALVDAAGPMLGADAVALVARDAAGRTAQVAGTDPDRTAPLCALPDGPVPAPSGTDDHQPAAGVLTIAELGHDARWPEWSGATAAAGYASLQVIGLQPLAHRTLALYAWARRAGAFDPDDRSHVVGVVRLGSLVVTQLERVENLLAALGSRGPISQAQGLLMERFSIGAEESMAYLNRLSQDHHVKVRDLAREVLDDSEPHRDGPAAMPLPGPHAPYQPS